MVIETFTRDNLVTATKPLITSDILQLETGQSVVRGQVLKKGTTGLVILTATTDTPYSISLQTVDASASAQNITYTYDGSVLNSDLTYGTGTIADFRDKFVTSTRLIIEE